MENKLFENFIQAVKQDNRILYDYTVSGKYEEIIKKIYEDVEKFDAYTLTGQLQDILIKIVKNYVFLPKTNYYNKFLELIYEELQKIIVNNIIIVPLNNLNLSLNYNDYLEINSNIKIFSNLEFMNIKNIGKLKKIKEKDSLLNQYFQKNIHANLSRSHILTVKEHNFFNYPQMTILIKNIPFKVWLEAVKITEAVYSFIRMLDMEIDEQPDDKGKFSISQKYGVYYNLPNVSKEPPFTEGYGYSFIFTFSPILSINNKGFINNLEKLNILLTKYINYCFINKNKYDKSTLNKIDKWLNAVLLFNSAYELASKEKYDTANLILLSLLESLFLKNSGSKKQDQLFNALLSFFTNNNMEIKQKELDKIISETYKSRSKFLHEGISSVYPNPKYNNDIQGIYSGMKPFFHISVADYFNNFVENLKNLFHLTINILKNYI